MQHGLPGELAQEQAAAAAAAGPAVAVAVAVAGPHPVTHTGPHGSSVAMARVGPATRSTAGWAISTGGTVG